MNGRIKKLRRMLDLTQQEFADRLNIKRNTVATYEVGKSNPSDAAVSLICKTFNVNEPWLRTGEGEMFAEKPGNVLEELERKYNLSKGEKLLIEKFLGLKPAKRQAVMQFVLSIAADYSALPVEPLPSAPAIAVIPPSREPTIAEMAARITELERQLAAVTGGAVDDAADELDEDDKALADKARKLVLEQRRSEERPESSASYANGLGAG